jgi:hypothetical protein
MEDTPSRVPPGPCVEYTFKEARLDPEGRFLSKVSFTTKTVGGTKYKFAGRFLQRPLFTDGTYVTLIGTLTKYKNGRALATAELKFVNWTYE